MDDNDIPLFMAEMTGKGLSPSTIIPDGKIHRFPIANGNGRQSLAGWYVFFTDSIPSGAFGNWKTGEKWKWCQKKTDEMSVDELESFRRSMAQIKADRDKIESGRYQNAKRTAMKIWESSKPVNDHPYLKNKRVQSHGLRVAKNGCLIVPVIDEPHDIISLQFINPDGVKKFLSGGKTRGGFFRINGDLKRVAVVEGYATGATVHNATGFSVFVAFNCHNLEPVVQTVRRLHSDAMIVVCADNDQFTDGNPGLTYGRKAADAVRAKVAVPSFPSNVGKPTDFNDLAALQGVDIVRKQIMCAITPGVAAVTAADIMRMDFPEPLWLIPGILPIGLCLFGGKPKSGKSLMADNLAIAIATGGRFFDFQFENSKTVLLIGLEDTNRRLQDRIKKMTVNGESDLSRLIICTEFRKADQGGLADLEAMIQAHNPALVVIDTLKKFKASSNGRKQLYDEDYESIDPIKKLSDRYGITIFIVHHLRKMAGDDPFDCFSGSLGLTGVADSLWVLMRRQTGMVLHSRGREMEDQELAVKLDPGILSWGLLGDAREIQSSTQQQAIYNTLKESNEPLRPKAISTITNIKYDVVKHLLRKMLSSGKIEQEAKGYYININNHSPCSLHSPCSPNENGEWVKSIHSPFSDNDINTINHSVNEVNGVNSIYSKEVKI